MHLFRPLVGLPSPEASLQRGDLPWLAAVILFGGMLGPLLLMLGLSQTSASSGSLLLNLEGLATMAIAWIVFRKNVDRQLILGAAAILAGAGLLSWTGAGLSLDTGRLFIAGACLCWGIDNNLTRKVSSAYPVPITTIKGLVAGSTTGTNRCGTSIRIIPTFITATGIATVLGAPSPSARHHSRH